MCLHVSFMQIVSCSVILTAVLLLLWMEQGLPHASSIILQLLLVFSIQQTSTESSPCQFMEAAFLSAQGLPWLLRAVFI
jgi:hypothetical protein